MGSWSRTSSLLEILWKIEPTELVRARSLALISWHQRARRRWYMIPHNPPGFCRVVLTGFSFTADLESILISTNCAYL